MTTNFAEKKDYKAETKDGGFDRTLDTKYYSESLELDDIESENARLRLEVLDLELKQRDYVAKIL